MPKKIKRHVKDVVGAGIGLGVGSMVLGGMGQGAIASKIVTPGANMLGVTTTAGMGMGIIGYIDKKTSKKREARYWRKM